MALTVSKSHKYQAGSYFTVQGVAVDVTSTVDNVVGSGIGMHYVHFAQATVSGATAGTAGEVVVSPNRTQDGNLGLTVTSGTHQVFFQVTGY